MKKIMSFLIIFLGIFHLNATFSDECSFTKDYQLVDKLKSNRVRVIVMRHVESNNNTKKIITCARTPGFCVTPRGFMQINDLLPVFSEQKIYKIFASSLYRCMQSTQLLGEKLDIPINNLVVEDRLNVQKFGPYERYPYTVYNNLFPSLTAMLETDLEGVESGAKVFKRTNAFLWHLANNLFDKTVLVITHAFNCCYISKCLTNDYGALPHPGEYVIYDFPEEHECSW